MAYTAIAAFATGEVVTAAKMNQIQDYLVDGSGARVYNNASISVANATLTALTFNNERYDTDTYHSTSSNTSRLTAPAPGLYRISGVVRFAANATGDRRVAIQLNGSTIIAYNIVNAVSGGGVTILTISTDYQLTTSDYVELMAYQASGGALNVDTSINYSPEFMIARF